MRSHGTFAHAARMGAGVALLCAALGAMAQSSQWRNVANPLDVNADGDVTPLDALLITSDLNANGLRALAGETSPPYLDVNGDGWVSPADLLPIVNFLNAGAMPGGQNASLAPAAGTAVLPADQAQDATPQFTFHVPVEVSNLHEDVVAIAVECYTRSRPIELPADARLTGTTFAGADVDTVGFGVSPTVAVPGGAYSGTLTVAFDAFGDADPSAATHYGCGLVLYTGAGRIHDQDNPPYASVTDPEHPDYAAWQPAEGTELVSAVSGPLAGAAP